MSYWTVCYWDLTTMENTYKTFDFVEDVKEFLEEHEIEIKKKLPLNKLDESVIVYPPNTEVLATNVLKGKHDYNLR